MLRPERNGSEIGFLPAFRMRVDNCAQFTVESALSDSSTPVISKESIIACESGVK